MPCPFCHCEQTKNTAYPKNIFNKKEFIYVRCLKCRLVYLNNCPDENDYTAMYPPSYQKNEVITSIQTAPYKKLPGLRFSYGFQFDLIKKQTPGGPRILDYGCGTGHFIANAINSGFHCDGAEFNPEYVQLLRAGIPEAVFYTIDQMLGGNNTVEYDVIRMSNVLEHIVEPAIVLKQLKNNLKPGGIILIEGPVEENFCLATAFRKVYFRVIKILKPKKTISSPPYHIFFSNRKNQRQFFKQTGFLESHFSVIERAWPFPENFKEAKGIKQKLMAMIARISIFFSKLFKNRWGNTFLYVGRKV
jgi:SAM-dependent methyltransferase